MPLVYDTHSSWTACTRGGTGDPKAPSSTSSIISACRGMSDSAAGKVGGRSRVAARAEDHDRREGGDGEKGASHGPLSAATASG